MADTDQKKRDRKRNFTEPDVFVTYGYGLDANVKTQT
jgi:hypothetical protein